LRLNLRRPTVKEVLLVVILAIVISIVGLIYAERAAPEFATEFSYLIRIQDAATGTGNLSFLAKVTNIGLADGYPVLRLSVTVAENRGFHYEISLGLLPQGRQLTYVLDKAFVGIDPTHVGVDAYVPNL